MCHMGVGGDLQKICFDDMMGVSREFGWWINIWKSSWDQQNIVKFYTSQCSISTSSGFGVMIITSKRTTIGGRVKVDSEWQGGEERSDKNWLLIPRGRGVEPQICITSVINSPSLYFTKMQNKGCLSTCNLNFPHFYRWIHRILTIIRYSVKTKSS